MTTPTDAQIRYLQNARAVMDAGTGTGNYFHANGPGSFRTAIVCSDRDWIEQRSTRGFVLMDIWELCFLTPDGRAVLEEWEAEHDG